MAIVYDARHVASPKEKRRVQDRAVDHVSGLYPSAKPAGEFRMVRYEGILMRNLFCFLENRRDVVTYEGKPFTVRYFLDGRWRSFTPHVVVNYPDKRKVAHVVTWSSFAASENFEHRRPAIEEALLARKINELVLTTEADVKVRPRIDNEALIASARTSPRDDEVRMRLLVSFAALGHRATVRELRRSVLHVSSFREIVRLVADGEWSVENIDAPFDDRAVIVRREI